MGIILVLKVIFGVYPMDPPTQRMLIESSDLIIRAKIESAQINSDTTGCEALISIQDKIFANHAIEKQISIGYNCLDNCDWPADFRKGDTALIYVRRLKSKDYYINGLSYGISYPSENAYEKIKQRINAYTKCKDNKSKVNWIVDGLKDSLFKRDVMLEFKYCTMKNGIDIYNSIDESQFNFIQESMSQHFPARDLSIRFLSHFYRGNQEIKEIIVGKIKYYRDSRFKHMATKYIHILNSHESSLKQRNIEKQLNLIERKEMREDEVIALINQYLETID